MRKRVVVAICLLIGAKVQYALCQAEILTFDLLQSVGLCVPILFKEAIDHFNERTGMKLNLDNAENTILTAGGAIIVACELLSFAEKRS